MRSWLEEFVEKELVPLGFLRSHLAVVPHPRDDDDYQFWMNRGFLAQTKGDWFLWLASQLPVTARVVFVDDGPDMLQATLRFVHLPLFAQTGRRPRSVPRD